MTKLKSVIRAATPFCFIVFSLILLLGRNHFALGTVYVLGRWGLVFSGIAIVYWNRNRLVWRHKLVMIVVGLMLFEIVWVKIGKNRLNNPEGTKELSIMTYNIFFKNRAPEKSLRIIHNMVPDILFVQEVSHSWVLDLNTSVGGIYPYRKVKALGGAFGIGIYSKYPLSEVNYLKNSSGLPYAEFCTVHIGDKKVRICNVHLASPAIAVEHPDQFYSLYRTNYQSRERQFQNVNKEFEKSDCSVKLLIGDLNTSEWEPLYREISRDWTDCFVESGKGLGFSFPKAAQYKHAFLRLDYIMGQGAMKPLHSEVIEGGSSDHFAVSSTIIL